MIKFRTKKWAWNHLQASQKEILQRCTLIEQQAEENAAIPATFFEYTSEELIQKQAHISPGHRLSKNTVHLAALKELAIHLDQMAASSLVHGDILPRHILYSAEQYWLIDWEPCFWQWRKEGFMLIATIPYIAPSEWGTTECLTSLSDKFAFINSCHKVLHARFLSPQACLQVELAARELTFEQLFDLFIN